MLIVFCITYWITWQVRPGLVSKDADGKLTCRPIFSRIVSLFAEQNELQYAVPGGLIGVGTKIEPTLCRADRLVGQVCNYFCLNLKELIISTDITNIKCEVKHYHRMNPTLTRSIDIRSLTILEFKKIFVLYFIDFCKCLQCFY